ncbi:MAG: COX15/CtaA family protein [Lysobacterales bacterium]
MIEHRGFRRLIWVTVVVTLTVIVLGAYVRLSHAGLGCPDWPGCYGHVTWPTASEDIARANEAYPQRAVEVPKAWKEMVHRFLAGGLGVIVLALAWIAAGRERQARVAVVGAALLAITAIAMYTADVRTAALLPAAAAMLWPIWAARRLDAPTSYRFVLAALGLIIFQALLGKWTVTMQLKPIVVTGHLLGGLSTFALLLWAALHLNGSPAGRLALARRLAVLALLVLIGQLFLGGWTSTNYAALACPDFPTCVGRWWPETNFREAFVLFREIGVNYEGGILDATARATIHYTHRIGALVVLIVYAGLILNLLRDRAGRTLGVALAGALTVQIGLGISNVVYDLPLPVATAHNGVAAVLLALTLVVLSQSRRQLR